MPDLLDFGVVKPIPLRTLHAESSLDLSSDHSPVLITIHSKILPEPCPPTLSTKHTNWEAFRTIKRENPPLDVPLKTDGDIEDYVHQFVHIIQQAAWSSTPTPHRTYQVEECGPRIKKNSRQERVTKKMANHQSPQNKAIFNKATYELKLFLNDLKQQAIQSYLETLTAPEATEYSLWKATKRLNRPQTHYSSTTHCSGRLGKE